MWQSKQRPPMVTQISDGISASAGESIKFHIVFLLFRRRRRWFLWGQNAFQVECWLSFRRTLCADLVPSRAASLRGMIWQGKRYQDKEKQTLPIAVRDLRSLSALAILAVMQSCRWYPPAIVYIWLGWQGDQATDCVMCIKESYKTCSIPKY